ncbi:odorant receptor 43a-like isoform X2 [Linepithema humile]|uniref:odorant receptor 43a-like isoform X2 n=1 Tax=Linepithema humile TaxID=83485 RepID=UPI00351EB79B
MDTSKSLRYRDFERAVKLNRVSLELTGLWPKIQQNFQQKLMCNIRVLVIFLATICSIIIPGVHSLIVAHSNLMLVVDNLHFTMPLLNCAIKIVIFWWKKEATATIINMMVEDWLRSKSAQERNVMMRRAESARKIVAIEYCLMGLAYVFVVILPICGIPIKYLTNVTDPGRPTPGPIQTYYIYDVMKTPQYELTYITYSITLFFAILCYAGIDNFLGLVVFHICGQLDILRHRFTHLDKYMNFHIDLKNCVMDHTRLLRAITIVDDLYNVLFLILFLCFAVLFAFYGFVIISLITEEDKVSIVRLIYLVSNVINLFAHMCLFCAVGEFLMAQCDTIYYAVYNQEWYTLGSNKAKNLIPLIIKSRKPVYLTAGKVFPMTLATFSNLLKTSAGYISVLFGMSV